MNGAQTRSSLLCNTIQWISCFIKFIRANRLRWYLVCTDLLCEGTQSRVTSQVLVTVRVRPIVLVHSIEAPIVQWLRRGVRSWDDAYSQPSTTSGDSTAYCTHITLEATNFERRLYITWLHTSSPPRWTSKSSSTTKMRGRKWT